MTDMPTMPAQHRPANRPDRSDQRREADQRRAASKHWRKWYSTARWRAIRTARLGVDPLCRYCLDEGRTEPATVVHHVQPHRGDPLLFYAFSNTESVCKAHHDRDLQRAENARNA